MTEYSKFKKTGPYIKPEKPAVPCTDNRCLKYPVCKSKENIICQDLLSRFHVIELDGSWDAWGIMREYFPNLRGLSAI